MQNKICALTFKILIVLKILINESLLHVAIVHYQYTIVHDLRQKKFSRSFIVLLVRELIAGLM